MGILARLRSRSVFDVDLLRTDPALEKVAYATVNRGRAAGRGWNGELQLIEHQDFMIQS